MGGWGGVEVCEGVWEWEGASVGEEQILCGRCTCRWGMGVGVESWVGKEDGRA